MAGPEPLFPILSACSNLIMCGHYQVQTAVLNLFSSRGIPEHDGVIRVHCLDHGAWQVMANELPLGVCVPSLFQMRKEPVSAIKHLFAGVAFQDWRCLGLVLLFL